MNFISKRISALKRKAAPIAHLFAHEPNPEKWVFIIGCYNSGTTLLHTILAMHPMIGSMPSEGQFFTNVLPGAVDYGIPRLWAIKPELFHITETSSDYNVSRLKRQWAFFYNDPDKPVLIEKTVINSARTRWLQKNFPNAYFISIIRNGYAVAEGIRRKAHHPIELAIRQWKVSNEIMFDDLQYIQKKIFITYEELAADTPATINRICTFLDIPQLDEDLYQKKFTIHKMSSQISDMNEKSFRSLSPADLEIINNVASEALQRHGYKIRHAG